MTSPVPFILYLILAQDPQALADLSATVVVKKAQIESLKFKKTVLSTNPDVFLKILKGETKTGSTDIRIAIVEGVNDKKTPSVVVKQGFPLTQETALQPLKDAINQYYSFANGIPQLEKDHWFSFTNNLAYYPPGKTLLYAGLTLLLALLSFVIIFKLYVVGIRRFIRRNLNSKFTVIRWLGFSFLLGVFAQGCSQQVPFEPYSIEEHYSKKKQPLEKELAQANKEITDLQTEISRLESAQLNASGSEKPPSDYLHKADFEKLDIAYAKELSATPLALWEKDLADGQTRETKLMEDAKGLKASVASSELISQCVLGGVVALFLILVLKNKLNKKNNSKTCPRCFEKDTLIPLGGDNKKIKCTSKDCGGRDFDLFQNDIGLPKITIPITGITSSGKTHWLTTFYEILANTKVQTSGTDLENRLFVMHSRYNPAFHNIASQIANGGNPESTTKDKFNNLYFPITDNHGLIGPPMLFKTGGITICFDYGGELFRTITPQDTFAPKVRDMIAKADGLVFFFDPTAVHKNMDNICDPNFPHCIQKTTQYVMDHQLIAFNTVCKHFGDERQIQGDANLKLPLSICVSKIDLVPKVGPLKGSYGERFLKELEKTKTDKTITLQTIHDRSDIVEKYLPGLLGHRSISDIPKTRFGNNFIFFPMACKGIYPERNKTPFGVLEPVLWNLHMHGFNVLK